MRWGPLLSTLLLAGAAAATPSLMSSFAGIDQKGVAAALEQVKSAGSGEALEAKAAAQWKALQSGKTEELPLESLAAVQDAVKSSAAQPDVASALLKALKNQDKIQSRWRRGLLADAEKVRRFYRGRRALALKALVLAAAALLAVIALGALPPGRGIARFLLGMAYGLSGRFLLLLSGGAAAYAAAAGLNPWPLLPPELFAAPIGAMLLSGGFLRILDPNYPLWNTALSSFSAPVAGCLGSLGWLKLKPF